MKIIFFGTPDFAVSSLQAIYESTHEVVAVVTTTDKYVGRNQSKLSVSEVKKYATHVGLKILQPKSLKNKKFLKEIRDLHADAFVVVAFRMMPEVLWSIPPKGTFNLHGSLLPAYRGAAPINWAIIRGEVKTGVTTFFIDKKIDTGAIILQQEINIDKDETAGELYLRMKELGAKVVSETLDLIENEKVQLVKQDDSKASSAPKIFHYDCMLDSRMDIDSAYNFFRGVSPYPGPWIYFYYKILKITKVKKVLSNQVSDRFIDTDYKTYMKLHFTGGYLEVIRCKYEGKKEMDTGDFLRGFKKPIS